MPEKSQYSDHLLAAAIEQVCEEPFVQHLGAWLESCISYDNLTWLAYYQNRAPQLLLYHETCPPVHEQLESAYLTGAYLLDPFHDLHVKQANRGVYRLSDIAPDSFHKNRYFIEYYHNTTLVDEIAFLCYPNPGVSIHLCFGRDASSNKRFTTKTIETANRIAPIVAALAEKHWSNLKSHGEYEESETTSKLITSIFKKHEIKLSPRQAEVAMLILRGHSSVSIGLHLGISAQTVKVFRKQLYKKCSISSQLGLFNLLLPLLGR